MHKLHEFPGGVVVMHSREHGVMHVHVFYGGKRGKGASEAVVRVSDGTIIEGKLSGPMLHYVAEWILANQSMLRANWKKLNPTSKAMSPLRGRVMKRVPYMVPAIIGLERLRGRVVRFTLEDGRVFMKELPIRSVAKVRAVFWGHGVDFGNGRYEVGSDWMVRGATYVGSYRQMITT